MKSGSTSEFKNFHIFLIILYWITKSKRIGSILLSFLTNSWVYHLPLLYFRLGNGHGVCGGHLDEPRCPCERYLMIIKCSKYFLFFVENWNLNFPKEVQAECKHR